MATDGNYCLSHNYFLKQILILCPKINKNDDYDA